MNGIRSLFISRPKTFFLLALGPLGRRGACSEAQDEEEVYDCAERAVFVRCFTLVDEVPYEFMGGMTGSCSWSVGESASV